MIPTTFDTACAVVYPMEPGLVHIVYNQEGITVEMARQHVQSIREQLMQDGKKLRIISDIRHIKKVDKAVRDYIATSNTCLAAAVLINSNFSRILGQMVISFSKPQYPTRLFTNKEKALNWLKKF